jgi:hypothetical protein
MARRAAHARGWNGRQGSVHDDVRDADRRPANLGRDGHLLVDGDAVPLEHPHGDPTPAAWASSQRGSAAHRLLAAHTA